MQANMGTVRMAFLAALEEAIDRTTHGIAERRLIRRKCRALFRAAIGGAFLDFATNNGADFADEDGESDTPIIDFWKWLIESGKIQPFLKFLVEEFFPALFEVIIALISAIAVI